MCGIVAIHSTRDPLPAEKLCAATAALAHRGPDGRTQWVDPSRRIGLGHTRLSVIDLETGAQPITSEDESIAIVANGEFYGFETIRRDLEGRGHVFKTKSDAEIVIHLYEEMGESCVEKLRGEFAFVLWDGGRQKLFAVRDRFGIKPLFHAEQRGTLFLASEAKALFAAGIEAQWDRKSVQRSLFLCIGPEQSLFAGIRQVPPGCVLTRENGETKIRRYWDPTYPLAHGAFHDSEADCIAKVTSLLEEAISLRMRADVPVGCLLSGGLDSSSVLGFASRVSSLPMRAFTISFDDPRFDESMLARETAAFAGADFQVVDAGKHELASSFEDSVAQGEIIQYNAHGTARYLLSRAIHRSGYKVVLAGEGADELFAGYGFASSAVMSNGGGIVRRRAGALLRLMRPANASEKTIRLTSPWLVRAARLLNLNPTMMHPLARRMAMMQSILSADFVADAMMVDPYRELFEELSPMENLRGRESAKQLIYLWMKSIFPGYVLSADRADMAHGVEVRLPFLDHVLFDYIKRVPVRILAANGTRKHLLREAARPVLTEAARTRAKKPLMAPPFTAVESDPLRSKVREILGDGAIRSNPFLDYRAVSKLADRPDTAGMGDPLLLMAASLCIIQERYHVT